MASVAQDALPNDVGALHALVLSLAEERDDAARTAERLRDDVAGLRARLEKALHDLRQLMRARFGASSERIADRTLPLFAQAAEEAEAANAKEDAASAGEIVVAGHRRRRRGGERRPLPEHLPREVVVHDLPEEEKICGCCGQAKIRIDTARREVLEYEPAQLKVIVHERPTYACGTCCRVSKAPAVGPTLPIPKSVAGPGLLAAVVVGKYCDHLPLYRLEGIMPRHGIEISRQAMCGWTDPLAALLTPLAELMAREVRASHVIQTDDTTVRTLGLRAQGSATSRFWCYLGDEAHRYAVFQYTRDREGRRPRAWLAGFAGKLQSDAYGGYDALGREAGGAVTLVGCLAHARRKFHESRDLAPAFCGAVLGTMRRLYRVEREAQESGMDAAQRLELRRRESRGIFAQLLALLRRERRRLRPKSPVCQAIEYMLARRKVFTAYLDDGALEIDNNACERAMKFLVIGRKNWLFCGSEFGGERAAVFFSVLYSARLHELEPWAYLRDVLDRLARRRAAGDTSEESLRPLLPDNWRREHPDKIVPLGR